MTDYDIKLTDPLNRNIFSEVAKHWAEKKAPPKSKPTSSTQVRHFYNELIIWQAQVSEAENPEKEMNKVLPFILMIGSKVAYAQARDNVDPNFVEMMSQLLDNIEQSPTPEILERAKLFMEAYFGYRYAFEQMAKPEKQL